MKKRAFAIDIVYGVLLATALYFAIHFVADVVEDFNRASTIAKTVEPIVKLVTPQDG